MPSFPNPEIQRKHFGESTSAETYQLQQKIWFLAKKKTLLVIKVIKLNKILTKMPCHTISKSMTQN
jgi:hypothetical protein